MWNFNLAANLRHRTYLLLFILISVFLITSKTVVAGQNNPKPSKLTSAKRKSSGPYCGLYCLYTTMKLASREIDFTALVKPEYIGSRKGSSLAELRKAAKKVLF